MGNLEKIIDGCLLTIGTATGLANIEHILGIVLLVIQLLWFIVKLLIKIVNSLKNKKRLDMRDIDVGSVINIIDDIKDELNSTEGDTENGRYDK